MKILKYITGSILLLVAIFSVTLLTSKVNTAKADLSGNINMLPSNYMKFATTSVSGSTVSLVLNASTARSWAVLSNIGSYPIELYFDNATSSIPFYANQATSSQTSCGFASCATTTVLPQGGLLLMASSTYEIKLDNLYQGAIYAVGAYSSTPASVISVIANQ